MKFNEILEKMREIYDAKNYDYSGGDEFGNFKESERIGVPSWKGAFIRLQDKYSRACNLIKIGEENRKVMDEKLEDTLLDLANYAVIVLSLLTEENNNKEEDNESEDEESNDCDFGRLKEQFEGLRESLNIKRQKEYERRY